MTAETTLCLVYPDLTAQRLFQRSRNRLSVPDSEIKTLNLAKVTDASLVKNVVMAKGVGLTDGALTKAKEDWLGNRVNTVRDLVNNALTAARDLIEIRAIPETQSRSLNQHPAIGGCL